MWRIHVNVVDVFAVGGTAAEVTRLSEPLYDSLPPHSKVLSHVDVSLTGGGTTLSVGTLGSVQFGIIGD